MSDFYQNQVIMPQDYDAFSFGFGVAKKSEALKITLEGSYGNKEWNKPTWHERLKPAYYQLQTYLEQYQKTKNSSNSIK